MLGRVREETRERLDVREHVAPLAIGEPSFPSRHRRARESLIYRAQQVGVGWELPARGRADLIDGAGEVARRRNHVLGRDTIPGARFPVTTRAPLGVDDFAGGCVLRKEHRARSNEQKTAESDAISHACSLLLAPCSLPTFSA